MCMLIFVFMHRLCRLVLDIFTFNVPIQVFPVAAIFFSLCPFSLHRFVVMSLIFGQDFVRFRLAFSAKQNSNSLVPIKVWCLLYFGML